jgi:hypothetical protein
VKNVQIILNKSSDLPQEFAKKLCFFAETLATGRDLLHTHIIEKHFSKVVLYTYLQIEELPIGQKYLNEILVKRV